LWVITAAKITKRFYAASARNLKAAIMQKTKTIRPFVSQNGQMVLLYLLKVTAWSGMPVILWE
jgi:hypothetical protein